MPRTSKATNPSAQLAARISRMSHRRGMLAAAELIEAVVSDDFLRDCLKDEGDEAQDLIYEAIIELRDEIVALVRQSADQLSKELEQQDKAQRHAATNAGD